MLSWKKDVMKKLKVKIKNIDDVDSTMLYHNISEKEAMILEKVLVDIIKVKKKRKLSFEFEE